ncbi:hypothetical protein OJAV_G00110590 [Oryzias javanicus]|uniref:RRM domain-containing protein n=1 Tax=Oryzias javanicus TaxID=123683 RepID=A0A3S2Q0Y5_ORYJA|nr:hypothetical protein OJAV_G00110590 [Oryzias javanicus]
MSRFNNNRGGLGMNHFQQRRGGGPIGPMRGGLMGNPHFRSHPFQHPNQNRRGHNNYNNNRPNQAQKNIPPKPQQSTPAAATPTPGPALTMKGPAQQQLQKPAEQVQNQLEQQKTSTPGSQPNVQSAPPKSDTPSSQPKPTEPNQQPKPAAGNASGPQQNQPSQQGPKPGPQQSPKPSPQQVPKPAPQQNLKSGPQQVQRPGPQQGPKPGVQQGQRPGPQQTPKPGPQQGQRPGQQQSPRPGGPQQGQRPGAQQGQKSGPQQSRFSAPQNQRSGPPQAQKGGFQSPQKAGPAQSKEAPVASNTTESDGQEKTFKATLSMLLKPGEKTYSQRCRLFVGNLPNDITEEDFKKMFAKYGEPSEVFINKAKGFGFIRLESRALAEIAKAELDDTPMRNRPLREAFSQFGMVERAIVIVDDRGRSTCKGIVEFSSRAAARKALDRCNEGVFLLTSSPRPVVVEPLEQYDTEDGLPEKLAQKNPKYQAAREEPPRFARPGTFEFEYAKRWKSLDEMEKQQRQQVEKNMREAREKLESEMDDAYHEHQANLLRQELLRRQEELRRMEEMHNQEMQKRKEMQLRQEEERRRREEEMLRKRDMEDQMRRREENYRMGNFMDRDREMRMHSTGALGMGDISFGGSQPELPNERPWL